MGWALSGPELAFDSMSLIAVMIPLHSITNLDSCQLIAATNSATQSWDIILIYAFEKVSKIV